MRTLIYQYWRGELPLYAQISKKMFETYAREIGADYLFDKDPEFFPPKYANYYHSLRPVFDDKFHEYDKILYVDMDILISQKLEANVFDIELEHIAMVEEEHQPELREFAKGKINSKNDQKWAKLASLFWGIEVARDEHNRPKVYNSGVVLFSNSGLKKAKETFLSIPKYTWAMRLALLPRFYRLDQNYFGVCAFSKGMNLTVMDQSWNTQVHYVHTREGDKTLYDARSQDTKFIHLQVAGRKNMSEKEILDFTALSS